MNTPVDVEELELRLERLKLRLEQMEIDAKKARLDAEERKKGLLSDLEDRLAQTRQKLEAAKRASSDRAEHAKEELQAAWEDLRKHFDRIARGPAD